MRSRARAFNDLFSLQWHITDECALHCTHCYRREKHESLDREGLHAIFSRFREFLKARGLKGRIHFAGGEPASSPHILDLLEKSRDAGILSRLLTSGVTIDGRTAERLADSGCSYAQVSIEGPREINDAIRGEGSFNKAMRGARELARAGIEVTLAMTLSRRNIGSLDQLASLGDGIAKRLYFSRFLPLRGGSADALDAGEWRTAMGRILALKGFEIPLRDPTFRPCFLSPVRALRAPAVAGCSIGYNSLAVESDGTAYLCRRLPVPAGNLLEDSIEEVMGQDLFRTLRDRDKLKGKCGACAYKWLCGGCRGAAYAMKCDMLAEDPQCPWPPARVHRAAAGAHPLRNRRLAP